jgi:2,5-furandicarboxylate decarboxylase 1
LYNNYIKRVIVVDEDVDIHVPWELDWAMATRVQPDRDLVVLERVDGSPIDPSVGPEAMGSRYGIDDATKPLGEAERFEKIAVPPARRSAPAIC